MKDGLRTKNEAYGNKQFGKETMSFNERALEYMLKGDMAGAGHAMWASDLAYGAQKGMGDIPHEFWKGIWSCKTRCGWGLKNHYTISDKTSMNNGKAM